MAALLSILSAVSPARAETYDGRAAEDRRTEDFGLWLLRSVFRPAYVVTEHLLRKPLTAVGVGLNESGVLDPSTEPSLGPSYAPLVVLDAGRAPLVGITVAIHADRATVDAARFSLLTWGRPATELGVRLRLWEGGALAGAAEHHEDEIFAGVGPRSSAAHVSRFSSSVGGLSFQSTSLLSPSLAVQTRARTTATRFADGSCCGWLSLHERLARGELSPPPGLDGTTTVGERVAVLADTVDVLDPRGTGAGAQASIEPVFVVEPSPGTPLVRWAGELSGRATVGRERLLQLTASAVSVETPRGGDVPLAELVDPSLTAFLPGRLRGQSAATLSARYSWPVWFTLEGSLGASVGNAFGSHFSGFSTDLSRASFDAGVRSTGRGLLIFRALVGLGTQPFADGGRISDVRLLLELTPRDREPSGGTGP